MNKRPHTFINPTQGGNMEFRRTWGPAARQTIAVLLLMLIPAAAAPVWAADDSETLRKQMNELKEQMDVLQK
jgi:hypothetical protein